MTAEQLQPILEDWQKRLRLQDWTIKLMVVGWSDGWHGRARQSTKYKNAEIQLVLRSAIDPDCLSTTDYETTLVHELLHVQSGHLTELLERPENSQYFDEMERLVELTAIALVSLKRDTQAKEQPAA